MIKRNWVERIISGIIILNVFVLAYVFFMPRTKFMIDHWKWEHEAIMETAGVMDTPNQFPITYKVANQIQKVTKENSIILMPTDNWEFGSNRAVIIQRLYPRKVYFFGDEGFYDRKNNVDFQTTIYAVGFSDDGADLCFKKESQKLGEADFVICKSSASN